jgi:hypothetical protein
MIDHEVDKQTRMRITAQKWMAACEREMEETGLDLPAVIRAQAARGEGWQTKPE